MEKRNVPVCGRPGVEANSCLRSVSSITQALISRAALGGLFSCHRPSKKETKEVLISVQAFSRFLRHLWLSRIFLQMISATGDSILSLRAAGGNGVETVQHL